MSDIPDGTVQVPLRARDGTVRAYTLIDAADAAWVNQWRWSFGKYVHRSVKINGRSTRVALHREVLGLPRVFHGIEGDHINRDRLDNRRANLRGVTSRVNQANKSSYRGSSSQYRGVQWVPRLQGWRSLGQRHGYVKHLGVFDDERDAARAAARWRVANLPGTVEDPALLEGPAPRRRDHRRLPRRIQDTVVVQHALWAS